MAKAILVSVACHKFYAVSSAPLSLLPGDLPAVCCVCTLGVFRVAGGFGFQLVRAHALLASFFLPLGIMFFVTGALYTVEITGGYESTSATIPLAAPLTPDLDALTTLANTYLKEQAITPPSGSMRVRKAGTSFLFEWTGSNRDVVLAPTENHLEAKIEVKDTTWYRRFVQLHKAKGGPAFKAFAVAGAAGLLFLFLSGSIMALRHPRLRRQSIVAAILGIVVFATLVFRS